MADSLFDLALDFIYSFIDYEKKRDPHVKITWDLRRVELLLEKLGNPHLQAKTVHIAGSKAKAAPRRWWLPCDASGLYHRTLYLASPAFLQ